MSSQLEGRLLIAADFVPPQTLGKNWVGWVRGEVLTLAEELKDTGVILMLSSALRVCGYELIERVHAMGVKCGAHLALTGSEQSVREEAVLLNCFEPDLVTVHCGVGVRALQAFKSELQPDYLDAGGLMVRLLRTRIYGATMLGCMDENDVRILFHDSLGHASMNSISLARAAQLDGIVIGPIEASYVPKGASWEVVVGNIRPLGLAIKGEAGAGRRSRVMTPTEAIRAGATKLFVGRAVTQAEDRHSAVLRIQDEMMQARIKEPA